jgi:hypothetical protein
MNPDSDMEDCVEEVDGELIDEDDLDLPGAEAIGAHVEFTQEAVSTCLAGVPIVPTLSILVCSVTGQGL